MAVNVKFRFGTKAQWLELKAPRDAAALYFCIDSKEIFKGDVLMTSSFRMVEELPEFDVAADGAVYFVESTKIGYVLNTARDEWVQVMSQSGSTLPDGDTYVTTEDVLVVKEEILNTVYTKEEIDAMGLGGGVESITFAGAEFSAADGVYSMEKDVALDALGIVVPESEDGSAVVLATETVVTEKVTEMSDEIKQYVDEQINNISMTVDSLDGGVIE